MTTALRELVRAKAAQTVISGVALTGVGYLVFSDKFVGTSGDLLAAFFWGFTTDLGVDAPITAAKAKLVKNLKDNLPPEWSKTLERDEKV